MPFQKGKSGNPKGGKKGNRGGGRHPSKVKQLAKKRGFKIIKRMADIADGKNLEQVVNENGESIKVPAAVREQIKAGEVVLKIAGELGGELEIENDGERFTVRVVNYV